MELVRAEVGRETEKKRERLDPSDFLESDGSEYSGIFHIPGWIRSSLTRQTTVGTERLRSLCSAREPNTP
jgi:hypothetical protein